MKTRFALFDADASSEGLRGPGTLVRLDQRNNDAPRLYSPLAPLSFPAGGDTITAFAHDGIAGIKKTVGFARVMSYGWITQICAILSMTVQNVFKHCVEVIRKGVLIQRVSTTDKEFHFQNWFKARLEEIGQNFEIGGRNSYPDFRMVASTDGYELKGLAYPGRDASFDSNSQMPAGFHNGRTIHYVFGRYPKKPDGNSYPVLDLVLCHGSFLNADHEYVHENKNVKGFGSYGDILIRDRKMYVVPTPFRIADGVAHHQTLILPSDQLPGDDFVQVGELRRREAAELIVGYSFDLQTNDLIPKKVPNPGSGREHVFLAWRLRGSPEDAVSLHAGPVQVESAEAEEGEDSKCD